MRGSPALAHVHAAGDPGDRARQVAWDAPVGPAAGDLAGRGCLWEMRAGDRLADALMMAAFVLSGRGNYQPRPGDRDMVPAARPRRGVYGEPVPSGHGRMVLWPVPGDRARPDQREMMLGSPFFWPGTSPELASLGRAESALWPAAILWTVIYALGALASWPPRWRRSIVASAGCPAVDHHGALVREQQTASSNSAGPGCTVGCAERISR